MKNNKMTNFEIGLAILLATAIGVIALVALYIKECKKEKAMAQKAAHNASAKLRFPIKSTFFNENFEKVLAKTLVEAKTYEFSLQFALSKQGDGFQIENLAEIVKILVDKAIEKKLISEVRFNGTQFNEQEITYATFAIALMAAMTKSDTVDSVRMNTYVKTKSNTPHSLAIVQRMFLLMTTSLYHSVMESDLNSIKAKQGFFDKLMSHSYNNVCSMTI